MVKTASKPLLICGYFNAPHTHWGYGNASHKGRRLAEVVDDLGLTLLNEPMSHTRIRQGVCRHTTRTSRWALTRTRDTEKVDPIKDIRSWCKKILADVEKTTKEIEWTEWWEEEGPGGERTEAPDPTRKDSCLVHLILAEKLIQREVGQAEI
ncbi:hypothetical protein HPB51_005966 [Rhipicephalus microplus]|uniref:Endonuclease/exonuclease/phosphatase domain-containing protein n=1 Tax=Rhipicephalus microplus TaxID=6941 RepID=A0A9J6E6J7_RHIMP|nr:hypothetical protein HPB51_005966 [Rhipicephalus microplus]